MKKLQDLINYKLMISIRKFEKETGVCRQTIMNILNNNHKPTELTVKKICKYFNVDYKEYL